MRIEKYARSACATTLRYPVLTRGLALAALALVGPLPVGAAPAKAAVAPPAAASPAEPAVIGEPLHLVIGKSTLLRLPAPVGRVSVGNPAVADVTVISPRELYLLGKVFGSTNIILWSKGGSATILDVFVDPDTALLRERLLELLPSEKDIKVSVAANSIVLTGSVSSATRAGQAVDIAEAFVAHLNRGLNLPSVAGDRPVAAGTALNVAPAATTGSQGRARVVNMLKTAEPQQVMLEVTVAEVSKTLTDKFGTKFAWQNGNWSYALEPNLLSAIKGGIGASTRAVSIEAAKNDGLVKVLAEPNIVAISGQEASFLAGGKIFIPVATAPNVLTGLATITLEEKEFGVGLKFTPTVLDGGRINLKVAPEVSELNEAGSPFTINGVQTAVLPSMTTRRAQTTVQLNDGQSFAIAGLIKNNANATLNRLPGLAQIPVLGALFSSNEFKTDQSELMFVITPRLVKPLPANYTLPTDNHVSPTGADVILKGKLEGEAPARNVPGDSSQAPAAVPEVAARTEADNGGFEVK